MKSTRKTAAGFTFVELVLFFAIAGLMMVGIFAAANNGINNQRYSSAVTSLVSYFQDQYSEVANVHNDRARTQSCGAGGIGTGSQVVGASDCMVIGRLITVDAQAKVLTSSPVYTRIDISDPTLTAACKTSDAVVLKSTCLNPVVDPDQSTTYNLEWDTRLMTSGVSPSPFTSLAILMYRSPLSGQINYIWSKNSATTVASLLDNAQTSNVAMCVDQSGWTSIPRMGVTIDLTTTGSSNAVSRIAGGSGC